MNQFSKITTSRWQGRSREGMSGGSLSAKLRVHGQERHIRPGFRGELAQDNETQGIENQGKWRDCATKVCILIWGDLSRVLRNLVKGKVQMGNWNNKPWPNKLLSLVGSESDGKPLPVMSACAGNCMGDGSEVSRGHSSLRLGVMAEPWRRTEHFPRRRLPHFHADLRMGNRGRNQS